MAGRANAIGMVGLGLALAAGLVASAALVTDAAIEVKRESRALQVKGFAERAIESDLAIWRGVFTTRARSLEDAYADLERAHARVSAFLEKEGIDAPGMRPVQMRILYAQNDKGFPTNAIDGYELSQEVEVRSTDIDRVERISRASTALVKEGVELSSHRPEYLYTGLGELKIAMLAEATADARRRAETLARESGGGLGRLLSAHQGVFQITSAHSTEVSDYGRNDTTSRQKSIKAVVTVRFAVAR